MARRLLLAEPTFTVEAIEEHRDLADLARLTDPPEGAPLRHRLDDPLDSVRAGRLAKSPPERRHVNCTRTQDG